MPRELNSQRNVLEIQDNISGSVLTLYFRMPTNSERVGYANAFFERKGSKVVAKADAFNIQATYGKKLCTGFLAGDFTRDGKSMSSTPGEAGYASDWSDVLGADAADVLAHLARHAFNSTSTPVRNEFEIEDLDKPEEAEATAETTGSQPAADPAAAEATEEPGDPLSQQ